MSLLWHLVFGTKLPLYLLTLKHQFSLDMQRRLAHLIAPAVFVKRRLEDARSCGLIEDWKIVHRLDRIPGPRSTRLGLNQRVGELHTDGRLDVFRVFLGIIIEFR